jgi:hypothetical protein
MQIITLHGRTGARALTPRPSHVRDMSDDRHFLILGVPAHHSSDAEPRSRLPRRELRCVPYVIGTCRWHTMRKTATHDPVAEGNV